MYSELFVESRDFPIPRVFGAPVRDNPSEYHQDVWHQKTRVLGYRATLY